MAGSGGQEAAGSWQNPMPAWLKITVQFFFESNTLVSVIPYICRKTEIL